ncbi:HGGxSTG domain-containing protein [Polynucleobacter sp.]|uniref:HGGxSTG domain-containing protein n=1 Tax=Polynucleobacter sp. TaxID=2029855 RepID=UPI003F6A3FBF
MPKCLAKKHSGGLCQNNAIKGGLRCKFHGGMSPCGSQHWNFQGKGCTKEERLRARVANERIRGLVSLAIDLGMISPAS